MLPEWIDANHHMNVGYYVVAFDHATDSFCRQIGVSWDYTHHRLGMVFVLEIHVTYERELRPDDPLRVSTQVLDHDPKRVHLFHAMYHGDDGWLAATNELMLAHISYDNRRPSPWPAVSLDRLQRIAEAHRPLPRPPQAGRIIGIRRS